MTKTLLISDLHCGGMDAPFPEKAKAVKGRSAIQKYLYQQYLKNACSEHFDYVIFNGDLVEGYQPVIEKELNQTNMNDQINTAIRMIEKMDYDKMLITMGTPFHSVTETGEIAEEIIAKRIGAKYAKEFFIDIDGYKTHITHALHHEGDIAGKLGREIETYRTDLIIRGHRHEFAYVETVYGKGVVTPGWQSRNKFGISNGLNATPYTPDIGCCVLETEPHKASFKLTSRIVDMSIITGGWPKISVI
jgi:predicted phosphodiesterase